MSSQRAKKIFALVNSSNGSGQQNVRAPRVGVAPRSSSNVNGRLCEQAPAAAPNIVSNPVPNPAPTPAPASSTASGDDVSLYTESECGVLSNDFKRQLTRAWVVNNKTFLKEVQNKEPSTPLKSQRPILVAYSPSLSSTSRQSDVLGSNEGKENFKTPAFTQSFSPDKNYFGLQLNNNTPEKTPSLSGLSNSSLSTEIGVSKRLGEDVNISPVRSYSIMEALKTNAPSDKQHKEKPSLTLGVRHPNESSGKDKKVSGKCESVSKSTPPSLKSKQPVLPGEEQSSTEAGPKLSPYQRLKLKNIAENEKILSEVLGDQPSSAPIQHEAPRKTPVKLVKRLQTARKPASVSPPTKQRGSLQRSSKDTARALINNISNGNLSDEDVQSNKDQGDDSDASFENLASPLGDDYSDSDESTMSARALRKTTIPAEHVIIVQEESAEALTEDSVPPARGNVDSNENIFIDAVENPAVDTDENPAVENPAVGTDENPTVNTDENPDNPSVPPAPKRKSKDLKAEMKELKNTGKSYVGVTGNVVKEKEYTPPHVCTVRDCHINVPPEVGKQVFKEYWQQANHDKRVSYVAARTEREDVQRKRPRQSLTNREKENAYKFFLDIKGKRVRVCRSTFIGTLGESDRFVRTVTENKGKSETGIMKDDARGRHLPAHVLKPETRECIQRHIRSFPAYVSHYCRAQTNLLYLPSHLTVAKMHLMYIEDGNPTTSYSTYLKEFEKSGRKFHAPKSDGCDKCCMLEAAIKCAPNEQEATNLKNEKQLHQRKAEKAYVLKKEAKKAALQNKEKKRVLIFDLQQCLPTPHLQCKKIYYSRQLNVYNFTIYDSGTDLTHCYMWDQVEGRRGSNELASCLLQHFLTVIPEGVEDVKMFSDCCSGQNRNHIVSMMIFAALQEHPTLKTVQHYFLVPGHTFMPEVDSKHAVIEKYKRKHLEKVSVPSEWYQAVEDAGKTIACPEGKFKVIHKTDFFDISALSKNELIKRKCCTDKEAFKYLDTHIFSYNKRSLGIVAVKSSFNEEAPFRELSFLRRGVRSDRLPRLMPKLQVLAGKVPVSMEKKKDLLELLQFLDVEHHPFYQSLPEADKPDTHADITAGRDSDDSDSESEN